MISSSDFVQWMRGFSAAVSAKRDLITQSHWEQVIKKLEEVVDFPIVPTSYTFPNTPYDNYKVTCTTVTND